jgi:hypothetical protein
MNSTDKVADCNAGSCNRTIFRLWSLLLPTMYKEYGLYNDRIAIELQAVVHVYDYQGHRCRGREIEGNENVPESF